MIIILSGRSGSGKTSACRLVLSALRSSGQAAGGTLCGAVFEGGVKVGIEFTDAAAGPGAAALPLAQARPELRRDFLQSGDAGTPGSGESGGSPSGGSTIRRAPAPYCPTPGTFRYGMWEFDESVLELADGAAAGFIAEAARPGSAAGSSGSIAIVDELGPLELDYGIGMVRTLAALDTLPGTHGGMPPDCVVVARPDIADRLESRWPGSRRVDIGSLSIMEAAAAVLEALGLRG